MSEPTSVTIGTRKFDTSDGGHEHPPGVWTLWIDDGGWSIPAVSPAELQFSDHTRKGTAVLNKRSDGFGTGRAGGTVVTVTLDPR